MKIRGRHYRTNQQVEITCADGVVTSIGPATLQPVDIEAGYIAPGFFDLQVNGCLGVSFNSASLTADEVKRVVETCGAHGVTGFLPTLVTNSTDALIHAFKTLAAALDADPTIAARVPGFHLEGPSVSPEDGPRGAHPREHVRKPDWQEFSRLQEAAGGRRLVTLAPEHDGALEFIQKLTAAGVVAAIGHTAASGDTIRAAVAAGARLSTHLGNGIAAVLPRHDNPIWEQLADDGLWASVIADGHHLPSAVLRSILRAKTQSRCILISDASSLAGLPPGRYPEWGQEFEVLPEGKIVVPGTAYLAGSAVFLDHCVAHAATFVGLADAVEMASDNPRALLGLPTPGLEVGLAAEFVLFDYDDGKTELRTIVV